MSTEHLWIHSASTPKLNELEIGCPTFMPSISLVKCLNNKRTTVRIISDNTAQSTLKCAYNYNNQLNWLFVYFTHYPGDWPFFTFFLSLPFSHHFTAQTCCRAAFISPLVTTMVHHNHQLDVGNLVYESHPKTAAESRLEFLCRRRSLSSGLSVFRKKPHTHSMIHASIYVECRVLLSMSWRSIRSWFRSWYAKNWIEFGRTP